VDRTVDIVGRPLQRIGNVALLIVALDSRRVLATVEGGLGDLRQASRRQQQDLLAKFLEKRR
jgi:hypothetical protein